MKSRWSDEEAQKHSGGDLNLRVYTSRLLGQESSLVLHGGGNTSVKSQVQNLFGERLEALYVKGSGWDLATIEPQGFSPVRMDVLLKLARLEKLSDADMVREQKLALLDPQAPSPSVEAILHAIIPYKFVDHTHADAVVAITNTLNGEQKIRDIYGERVLIVPYVMPGFILARKIFELTRDIDWQSIDAMILLNHGVFTFSNEARLSYESMINIVTAAEKYLESHSKKLKPAKNLVHESDDSWLLSLAQMRKEISGVSGFAQLAQCDCSSKARDFSELDDVGDIATRGTLTPDHVIHTKPSPLVVTKQTVAGYVENYREYFERNATAGLKMLQPAPRWAVWPGRGIVGFGPTTKSCGVVLDIAISTMKSIEWGEGLGGWKPLAEAQLFEVEYWELEQAKLKKVAQSLTFQGRVALVTGAASGIGRAVTERLLSLGAAVVAVDLNPIITESFSNSQVLGICADVTNSEALRGAVMEGVKRFGGLDIVVSNAGIFPAGQSIEQMNDEDWDKSLAVNLTSHERLIKFCVPFLKLGIDANIVVVASKNVPAPGPGASAYSVAKAGLTQLSRVAALELAAFGIRVNVVHPDAVFDTGVWTKEVLENRAKHYGVSVEEYKKKNLLKCEITSKDVAEVICALAGPGFSKTTGTQVSVDGGNDRVI